MTLFTQKKLVNFSSKGVDSARPALGVNVQLEHLVWKLVRAHGLFSVDLTLFSAVQCMCQPVPFLQNIPKSKGKGGNDTITQMLSIKRGRGLKVLRVRGAMEMGRLNLVTYAAAWVFMPWHWWFQQTLAWGKLRPQGNHRRPSGRQVLYRYRRSQNLRRRIEAWEEIGVERKHEQPAGSKLTSVDDPHRAGYSFRHVGLQPLPQFLVYFLSLRITQETDVSLEIIENTISETFSELQYLPAVGRQSCQCQWPRQAHKQARPCSSPLRCLWKGRVIRLSILQVYRLITIWLAQTSPETCVTTFSSVLSCIPAMNLVWAKTTFSVMPPSLSSSFSPMQAITPRPFSRAWAVFWPIS